MEKPILKPLNIAELLDKVLQLYKRHALLLMLISAVILIPSAIIRSVFLFYFEDTRLVDNALNIFLSPFAELATVAAISSLYLGNDTTVRNAFSTSAKRYWARFRTVLLIGLAMIPAGLLIFLTSLGGSGFGLIGIIIFLPVVAYLSTRWSLATAAVVLEGVGAVKGMERSWALTEGYFWRVFGTSFAAGLLSLLLSTLPALFVTYLFEEILSVPLKLTMIVSVVMEQLTTIITFPLTLGVTVLIYYDLRIRKEGFDLIHMSAE